MKIKWLLVDIGNVLLLKDSGNNFNELLSKELNVDIELAQKINKVHYSSMDIKYIPEEEFIADLEIKLNYRAPKDIFTYFAKAYEKQVRPNIELFNSLEEMRKLGIKTAILSNTISIYRQTQEQIGISKQNGFDPIVLSWQEGIAKPNRDIFELALKKLKVKPEEVIFIDDSVEHIKGAEQVGIRGILFDNTKNVIKQIRELIILRRINNHER